MKFSSGKGEMVALVRGEWSSGDSGEGGVGREQCVERPLSAGTGLAPGWGGDERVEKQGRSSHTGTSIQPSPWRPAWFTSRRTDLRGASLPICRVSRWGLPVLCLLAGVASEGRESEAEQSWAHALQRQRPGGSWLDLLSKPQFPHL